MAASRNRGRGQTAIDGIGPSAPTAPATAPLPGISPRRAMRRVERAVTESIAAARAGEADVRLRGAETLARELARGIDVAASNADPYALAQLSPKLLDVLRELGIAGAGPAPGDATAALLADLGSPE